ncbi:MAG TPA: ribosome maturation factor RimP [Actinocrinis sp.]|nr:ribosome maturation factor RimP [Actinocrinis sp.]
MPASDTMAGKLRDLIAAVVTESGFDLEELVEQRIGSRILLRVVVDGDEGISLDDIAEVSQAVSTALDQAEQEQPGVFGDQAYDLELSSPGVGRPLTAPRHWRRAHGRLVKATAKGSGELTGRVLASTDEEVTLLVTVVHKPGQKPSESERTFAYADLSKAKVQVEFNRAAFEAIEAESAGAGDPDDDGDEGDGEHGESGVDDLDED